MGYSSVKRKTFTPFSRFSVLISSTTASGFRPRHDFFQNSCCEQNVHPKLHPRDVATDPSRDLVLVDLPVQQIPVHRQHVEIRDEGSGAVRSDAVSVAEDQTASLVTALDVVEMSQELVK